MTESKGYVTRVTRYYVDIRPLVQFDNLPLLRTLPEDQQSNITRYLRPADRLMSLASALLKYVFIHQYARLPWNQIHISRTPAPHKRPYWEPTPDWTGDGGLEFNVTHQAGLVGLVGCKTPTVQRAAQPSSSLTGQTNQSNGVTLHVRLGIDVACTNEDKRTPKDLNTQPKFDEWVDIFGEMFSEQEREEMKYSPLINLTPSTDVMEQKLRRFYAFWALKEAYIKMVGEGLLASWLTELEFSNVIAPHPPEHDAGIDDGFSWALRDEEEIKWTLPDATQKGTLISMSNNKVDTVETEITAYERDFLFATATSGVVELHDGPLAARWMKLDIERDIRPCAEGRCHCLERQRVP